VIPSHFADTSFWIALSSKLDQHHDAALAWTKHIAETQSTILTTEAVLWEWMNALADARTRSIAGEGYRRCHRDTRIQVAPFAPETSVAAVRLYEARYDKGWSRTDCLSFTLMERFQISAALTTDHHFAQAGFRAVLLEVPPGDR
jgi:predicted nucleic acid-binding protein